MSVPGTAERSVAGSGVSMVLLTEKSPAGTVDGVCSHGLDNVVGTFGATLLPTSLKVASGVWIVSGSETDGQPGLAVEYSMICLAKSTEPWFTVTRSLVLDEPQPVPGDRMTKVNAAPPAALVAFRTVFVNPGWATGVAGAELPRPPTTVRPIRTTAKRAKETIADPFSRLLRLCR